jgi:hypothetical protein
LSEVAFVSTGRAVDQSAVGKIENQIHIVLDKRTSSARQGRRFSAFTLARRYRQLPARRAATRVAHCQRNRDFKQKGRLL